MYKAFILNIQKQKTYYIDLPYIISYDIISSIDYRSTASRLLVLLESTDHTPRRYLIINAQPLSQPQSLYQGKTKLSQYKSTSETS